MNTNRKIDEKRMKKRGEMCGITRRLDCREICLRGTAELLRGSKDPSVCRVFTTRGTAKDSSGCRATPVLPLYSGVRETTYMIYWSTVEQILTVLGYSEATTSVSYPYNE